jgi:hypothetical protein
MCACQRARRRQSFAAVDSFQISLAFQTRRSNHRDAAQSAAPRRTKRTICTIDETDNITGFANAEQTAAASATRFDLFTNQQELIGPPSDSWQPTTACRASSR